MIMFDNIKSFFLASFGIIAMGVVNEIPGVVAPWIQLLIGLLTVAYFIKKLLKK